MRRQSLPPASLADVERQPFPAVLEPGDRALFLFAAAFLGSNDAIHAADVGLVDVTLVDRDRHRLDEMRELYPATWELVAADVFTYVERDLAPFDVVVADPFTNAMQDVAWLIPRLAELAERVIVVGYRPGLMRIDPPGWQARPLVRRSTIASWLILDRDRRP